MADDLSYGIPRQNAIHRALSRVSSSRPGAWLFSDTLAHLDSLTRRLTKGRSTLSTSVGGLPVLMLTSVGRHSGLPRETSLTGVPFGNALTLVAPTSDSLARRRGP